MHNSVNRVYYKTTPFHVTEERVLKKNGFRASSTAWTFALGIPKHRSVFLTFSLIYVYFSKMSYLFSSISQKSSMRDTVHFSIRAIVSIGGTMASIEYQESFTFSNEYFTFF